ncbi:single-stranded DNA-binding protein [Saccharothrix hoggarensis]|uniref:Single-stranded DNA-binding protein n=1 Tax=Saccharothrix hoggarensis TaxID=913853 RepID=A0ABW3QGB0_9PSEU
MAYNETRVTLCGNVASKVTHTKVGAGFSRAGFRLFTTERVWDKEQRTWSDGAKMLLSVTCWRMLADNANASLNKGDPIVVTGRLLIKDVEYEGSVRQVVEVEATAIGPNLALCTATPVRTRLVPDAVEARAAPDQAPPEPPAPGPTAPDFVAPEIVAPRRGDDPPPTAPTDRPSPKEATGVPF